MDKLLFLALVIFMIAGCGEPLFGEGDNVIRGDCNYAEAPCDASDGDETTTTDTEETV